MISRATIFWSKGIRSLLYGNTSTGAAGRGVVLGPQLRCHEITDGDSLVMMGWRLHQTRVSLSSLSFVLIIISGLDGDSGDVLKKLHCEQLRCEDIKGTINVWVMWTQCLGGLTNKTWIERLNITEMRDGQITWSINNSNNNNRNDPLQSHQCVAIGCIMLMPGCQGSDNEDKWMRSEWERITCFSPSGAI